VKGRKWLGWGVGCLLVLSVITSACVGAAAVTPTPTKSPASATVAPTKAPASATVVPTQPAAKPTAAATATPAAPAAQASSPGKTTTVRFGSPGVESDSGVYIAMDKGYFKEVGLEVEIVKFQSGPMMIAPLSSGDLEVGGGVISPALLNAIDRGVALKMVGSKGASVKGFEFSRITIRKDLLDSGKVKDVKDVKGMKVAVPSVKSGAEAQVEYFLHQGGLTISDVEVIQLAFPDMIAAYANKAIDLAVQTEPTLNTAVQKGLAVRWAAGAMSAYYGTGEYQASTLVFSEPFSKNLDAARKFMVAYLKGVRDYNDAFAKGKNKDQVVSILTKYTPEKDPALFDQMEMPYLSPDGKINVPSMTMDLDYFKKMGYYTGNLTMGSIIDTQFVDYAQQQLGPYK